MMGRIFMAGVALVAFSGAAYAEQLARTKQPVALSDQQMDHVTAGSVGIANAAALALGEVTAVTITQTSTNVVHLDDPVISIGQAFAQSLASGGFLFQAAAVSHVDTAASFD